MDDLLKEFSDDDVYEAFVAGLSGLNKDQLEVPFGWNIFFSNAMGQLGRAHHHGLRQLYANGTRAAPKPGATDANKLLAATWRLVTARLVVPKLEDVDGVRVTALTLTELGRATARAQGSGERPGRPGYLARLRRVNPKIAAEVFDRLEDAEACLDADLLRPAFIMIGVAAEHTTNEAFLVLKPLMGSGKAPKSEKQAERLAAVLGVLPSVPNYAAEDRHALTSAFVFIETLRDPRNQAAHPGTAAPDPWYTRDRFGSACHHLTVIWNRLIILSPPQ